MRHLPTIIDIIESGMEGDKDLVRGYTEVLLQFVRDDQTSSEEERTRAIIALEGVLKRGGRAKGGYVIYPAAICLEREPQMSNGTD